MKLLERCLISLALLVTAALAPHASAQQYPAKSIRLILPFPPGGPTDIMGRALVQKLSEQMGQQVIPDNRPGAGGNFGLELAAKSPPDGYTMVLAGAGAIAISPSLYAKLNYRQQDLAPISLVAEIRIIVVVHPSVPAKSMKELIALARKNPGKLNYGSGGIGTGAHLTFELIKSITKTNIVHVPFKGMPQGLVALMSGEIDMLIMAVPVAQAQVQAGKVRALVVLSTERASALPEVPSAREAGVEDYIVRSWYGMLAPAGTPANLIGRLNSELVKALNSADLRKRFQTASVAPLTSTPEQFADFIKTETVRYAKVIKDANIPAQ
jgi:tripartite-type tricarboxylate transporter receptor subunit TctC